MKTFSVFVLILIAGVSSETVDGEGLAKELTAIRDEIGEATGIKFSLVRYKEEIESAVKDFNRDCSRWSIPDTSEYRYVPATIKLSDDDQIDSQLVKATLGGKHHPDPDVQRLNKPPITFAPMMWYLWPDLEKIGCELDISCSSPLKTENEKELAKILGKSKERTMDGGCILGMYSQTDKKEDEKIILEKIGEYYFKNGLEERLEKLLITKTGGRVKRQARDVEYSSPMEDGPEM